MFNETINGNLGFNKQTIIKDIESDFNGVYSRYEKKLKNELYKKIDELIELNNLKESFDDFIRKQKDLCFTFQINNDDFTFYGSCNDFNSLYEKLKKAKTFTVNPKEIFFDIYEAQKKKFGNSRKEKKI